MATQETVLCMQLGKCFFNFLPFPFIREAHSQSSIISLLILIVTDALITGFLILLWFGGWLLSTSQDVVFMRFLTFQNETYRTIPLLIPWICFSEEWSRSHTIKLGGTLTAETPLSAQSRLLSVTCWLIAGLIGKQMIAESMEMALECDHGEWLCLFTFINTSRTCDWPLLLSVGLLLGITLFHSTKETQVSVINIWSEEKRNFKELAAPLLLTLGSLISFFFLPPFITVNSWSILALNPICSLFRFLISQPLHIYYQ
ncbi:hypothetical protein GDO81_001733 [Engystomops pustulosus]|uniref:Taste receptor type 2 n=1 Tax=Engystomops pustulosus TaxID=76066 RepID=A0AAV7DGI8_ENGPU|nr:hypothetical protein GDO81_001733 [Engystomops pustulosus]